MKAIIEIPQGSTKKIEIKDGIPMVDRMLSIPCPFSYGFIPGTMCEDGDALDVFVLSNKYLDTLDEVEIIPIGMFKCTDQGLGDDKMLAKTKDYHNEAIYLKEMVKVGMYLTKYKEGFKVNDYKRLDKTFKLEDYK